MKAKRTTGARLATTLENRPDALQTDCLKACSEQAQRHRTATRYYERELPERLAREKQTLAKLTGWSLAEIDRMGADSGNVTPVPVKAAMAARQPPADNRTWWQSCLARRSCRTLARVM